MKRKRASQGSAPAKKKAGAFRAQVVAKPQKSLRFQVNTIHGPNPEKKEITNATYSPTFVQGSSAFAALAAGSVLNAVVQGTTAETRLGRKIRMRSLDIRWNAGLAVGTGSGDVVRVLVVYDKQANAALPAILQIVNTNDWHAPMNLSNSDRFTVIRSFLTEPLSVQNNFNIGGHEFIPMDLEAIYNDTNGGTIADIQTGSLLFLVAALGTATVNAVDFTFISRIRFDDN